MKLLSQTDGTSAEIDVVVQPLSAQLLSLALLTESTPELQLDPWVAAAAARLTPEQRARNRLIFGALNGVLDDDLHAADLPAYVAAIARVEPAALLARAADTNADAADADAAPYLNDGVALRDLLVAHLRELWESALAPEWRKHGLLLRASALALKRALSPSGDEATVHARAQWDATMPDDVVAYAARARARRIRSNLLFRGRTPDWAATHLARARGVRLSLSPHVAFALTSVDGGATAHVFAQFDNTMMRVAPVRPAEVLARMGALADETRLRVLELLAAKGELRGQEIIAELGASQPVVSRNLKLLVGAGRVGERRAGDTNKWYRLRTDGSDAAFVALDQLLDPDNARADIAEQRATAQRNSAKAAYPEALQPFIDQHGRVHAFSPKRNEQQPVLDYLFAKIETGREYTEPEISHLIASWLVTSRHGPDYVTMRRALVEERGLKRTKDGARYWREA